jgi:hypothetical protein
VIAFYGLLCAPADAAGNIQTELVVWMCLKLAEAELNPGMGSIAVL